MSQSMSQSSTLILTPVEELSPPTGDKLATKIKALHAKLLAARKHTVDQAIEIGGLLVQAKSKCEHGEWLKWLKENVGFSRQTADNYVTLYEKREGLKLLNVGSLSEAYKLVLRHDLHFNDVGRNPKQVLILPPGITAKQWGLTAAEVKKMEEWQARQHEPTADQLRRQRGETDIPIDPENKRKHLEQLERCKNPEERDQRLRVNLQGALARILNGTGKRRERAIEILLELLAEAHTK
jgi:hypothetical protein